MPSPSSSHRSYPHLFNIYDWEQASDVTGRKSFEFWDSLMENSTPASMRRLGVAVSGGIHSFLAISAAKIYGLFPSETAYVAVVDAEYAAYCLSRGAFLAWDVFGKTGVKPIILQEHLPDAKNSNRSWQYLGEVSDEAAAAIGDFMVADALDGIFGAQTGQYELAPKLVNRLSQGRSSFEFSDGSKDKVRLFRIGHYPESVLPSVAGDPRVSNQENLSILLSGIREIWEKALESKSLILDFELRSLTDLIDTPSYFDELAAFTGASDALSALYSGVPLSDIVA